MKKNVVIVGAGLVGSLLGIYLAKRGYSVSIYERRPDMRTTSAGAGRSINLALSDRGILALEEVGIMDAIREIAIPMHGRCIHNANGTHAYQPYGQTGQFINSVSRGELNRKLMDLAEAHGIAIHFEHKCDHINWKDNTLTFAAPAGQIYVQADLIFGADGAYSAARLTHQLQHERFDYQQFFIDFGYKELTIPASEDGGFQLEKNALHIWPRGNYMLIALPNMDGSFTCTLFFPFDGDPSFASLDSEAKVQAFFAETFADATAMMPGLAKEYLANPTASLITVKCFPWVRGDQFALIGDAAHAIVPFFGQGMNCGFEDCRILNQLIDEYAEDWSQILPAYQALRKPDADAIAELALNNFIEMRDKVGDARFLLQKKIEAAFTAKYPGKWLPAYAQVTFTPNIRYSEALRNGQRQEAIMQEIMAMPGIAELWNDDSVMDEILNRVEEHLE